MRKSIATFVLTLALCSVPAMAGPRADNAMRIPVQEFSDRQMHSFWSNFYWMMAAHAYMFAAW